MRRTILALAALAASCGPQPVPADSNAVTNVSAPLPPEPHLSLEECLDHGDTYCVAGRRGTPAHPCFGITAYLADGRARDVRVAPDAGSRVLGRIYGDTDKDESLATSFAIIDSRDGWLKIDHATDDPDTRVRAARKMYAGSGWIRGESVRVSAQASRAFASPDFAGAVAIQLDAGGFDGAEQVATLGCDGSWVQARWRFRKDDPDRSYPSSWRPEAVVARDPLVLQGWVTGICGNLDTTCDGLSGDSPRD